MSTIINWATSSSRSSLLSLSTLATNPVNQSRLENLGLSYNDVYKVVGLNESNITDKATQAVTNALREKYSNGDDFDTYNNKSINNYKTSVSNDTIKFFIDGNKKLNIIVTLEIPVGNGQIDTIITVE